VTTLAAARAKLVAALEGEGLRVAQRSTDVTPPCVYVWRWSAADQATLAGGHRSGFGVHWIQVRNVDNPDADDAALQSILDAAGPLSSDLVELVESSVMVGEVPWPCYRAVVYVE